MPKTVLKLLNKYCPFWHNFVQIKNKILD
jgi:hypothetical protein